MILVAVLFALAVIGFGIWAYVGLTRHGLKHINEGQPSIYPKEGSSDY